MESPKDLYKKDTYYGERAGYKYFPNFAVIVGVPLALLPTMMIAYQVFFIINIFMGILFIILFNKTLVLLNLNNKLHRFLILVIISNGWHILLQYKNNQTKFWFGVLILIVIIREIKYQKGLIKKDLKFLIINYNIFIFIFGMFPYFFFHFLIYIFYDIPNNEIFRKYNMKKYLMVIGFMIAQNFLFLLSPDLIFDYIEMVQIESRRYDSELKHFYLWYFTTDIENMPKIYRSVISAVLNIILYSITIFLTLYKRLRLEEKIALISFSIILFNYIGYRIFIVLLPLICLIFIPFFVHEKNLVDFVKKNKYVITGLLSVSGLCILSNPNEMYYPNIEIMWFGLLICTITLSFSIFILYWEKFKAKNKTMSPKEAINSNGEKFRILSQPEK